MAERMKFIGVRMPAGLYKSLRAAARIESVRRAADVSTAALLREAARDAVARVRRQPTGDQAMEPAS